MSARTRILLAVMRAFVLVFGAAALWLARDGMNPDGIAYLDASDIYGLGTAASGTGYWSPLYPLVLTLARLVAGTSPARELAIVQTVNLGVFVLAFLTLEYLVWEVRRTTDLRRLDAPDGASPYGAPDGARPNDPPDAALPNDTVWLVLVYALFAVVTVGWIRVWMMTPDMLVAAIVFAVSGVCVRLTSGRGRWPTVVALGVLLGLGYLAKAAVFPIAIVTLATLAFAQRRSGGLRQAVVAGVVFLVIAAPQLAYASRLKESATFGDVGRLSYLWFIAQVPGPVTSAFPLPARLPSPSASGQTLVRLDPTRDPHPAIYDIDEPIPGTLPIWYDAGHWYRGVTAPFLPIAIVRTAVRQVLVYLELFGFVLVGAVAALLVGRFSRRDIGAARPAPLLVVPALAALAMYALVLVQPRYVAPFALVLFAGLVPPWATDDVSRRVRIGLAAGAVASIPLIAHQTRVDATYWRGTAQTRANVVAALGARGIGPGTRLGFIGEAYEALWARTARVRFVSLVPSAEAEQFWKLDSAGRAAVLTHMQQHGAQAIIAESPALGVSIEGWERLPSAGVPRSELIVYGGLR